MAHEVETMFSAREVPWHRLGVVTPDVLTSREAIVAGGLDWTVEKHPIYRRWPVEDGELEEVPNRFALTRNTDGFVTAVVSDIYKPFQNVDAFEFMDGVTGSTGAKYETAGSLKHGRVVFITIRMENSDFKVAGMDPINTYLLLRTTHDGTGRIKVYVVQVRVVCMNTLTWAINGAKHQWGVTHTSDVRGKVAEAREALGLTAEYNTAFQAEAERLLKIKITDDDLVHLLRQDLPDVKLKETTIELILDDYRTSETVGDFYGTAWGALNAVSEFKEHIKPNRSAEAAFQRLIDGPDFKLRSKLKDQFFARA